MFFLKIVFTYLVLLVTKGRWNLTHKNDAEVSHSMKL